jgi:hypothetical protein
MESARDVVASDPDSSDGLEQELRPIRTMIRSGGSARNGEGHMEGGGRMRECDREIVRVSW